MGMFTKFHYSAPMVAAAETFRCNRLREPHIISDTVVYYFAGNFVHAIIDFVITVSCNRFLSRLVDFLP